MHLLSLIGTGTPNRGKQFRLGFVSFKDPAISSPNDQYIKSFLSTWATQDSYSVSLPHSRGDHLSHLTSVTQTRGRKIVNSTYCARHLTLILQRKSRLLTSKPVEWTFVKSEKCQSSFVTFRSTLLGECPACDCSLVRFWMKLKPWFKVQSFICLIICAVSPIRLP